MAEALAVVNQYASQREAAEALNISRHALRRRLMKSEAGENGFAPVMPGFAIKQVSSQEDGAWIKQTRAPGEEFQLDEGHVIKGVSALVDGQDRVHMRWIKTQNMGKTEDFLSVVRKAFDGYEGLSTISTAPQFCDEDLLTIYPIVDLHLGLYAWGRETGHDYDLTIASDLLKGSMRKLVARSADAQEAIILDMGDYFHMDNSRNQTARSGNPLDVDSRYAKVLQVGVELAVECIELALQKHERVIYRKLPGNHDDETSLMLAIALSAWFRNDERVTIDTDPSRFYMRQFGKVMIAATHGDMLKMGDMAGFMAANWPRSWGETVHRYAYTGHVHHDRVKSGGGVRSESFNTLAAKDAWHAASGYVSPRSAVSITMHKQHGEVDRLTVNLPGPLVN